MHQSSPAAQISLWADKLRDLAALGLFYDPDMYDRERYEQIQSIALEMMTLASGLAPGALEPLRETLFMRPTPFSVGDGAVVNDNGEMLLIQRADNKQWAMPGGALTVGETPAEGVVREVFEETGVRCAPVSLVGVHDSRCLPGPSRHQMYMFCFLCKPLADGHAEISSHSHEVLDIGWFAEDSLPGDLDPRHVSRIPEAFRVWRGDTRPFFDALF